MNSPAKLCGAKNRQGNPCKRKAMTNGRCDMHGGKATGRPVTTGRGTSYTRIFGERFAALAADPDLLNASAELALHDLFLTERAEVLQEALSSAWIKSVSAAVLDLRDALFGGGNAAEVRQAFDLLKLRVDYGREKVDAWEDVLGAAKQRSEIAAKAEANLAKRETAMTETQVMGLFVRMLEIVADVVGTDHAGRVKSRFEVEVLGRLGSGVSGSPPN